MVDPTLRDLLHHHAWADAEHWRSFTAFPAALEDDAVFSRLHHVHLTQSAWVWALGDRRGPFASSTAADFVPASALRSFAIENHMRLEATAASEAGVLDRCIAIPWFDDLKLSVREGLTQVAMHSHYHRGQNATRFRELGGEPPETDLITWISKGRPSPNWTT